MEKQYSAELKVMLSIAQLFSYPALAVWPSSQEAAIRSFFNIRK
jgi:hypothetical protein